MAAVRYSWDHLRLRARGAPVPLYLDRIAIPQGPLVHRNSLPRSAFDLPAQRFGAAANLIDCVEAAVTRLTGQPQSIISPVGSVVYARRDGGVLWPLVHDVDVWCHAPAGALRGRSLHAWHVALQQEVHRQFQERGVRSRLTWPHRYVTLVDADGSVRMVELKIAHSEWLTEGLAFVHQRFCGLRARRGRAYSLRPRLEWASYSAFENHYTSEAAEQPFRESIADVPPQAALRALQFIYHENLAAAMRRLGPAHVLESRFSQRRLARNRVGVLKKILMLAVLRRDEGERARVLAELEDRGATPDRASRAAAVTDLVARLDALAVVDAACLAAWLEPPIDLRETSSPVQCGRLGEPPAPLEKVGG